MFRTEKEALDKLLNRRNTTKGTEHLAKALAFYDHPHLKRKTIQIAGTNGKGSTAYYLSQILRSKNKKVGLFTSPHLITHRDRIRVNHAMISSEDFLRLANHTYPLWDLYHLSMFDIDFLIASLYFLEKEVDYAIYEVGLGGRYDASSLLKPEIQAITNVSYDHMDFLGDSLEAIANEKAAIFKKNTPVYTQEEKPEVLKVFDTWAEQKKTSWKKVSDFSYSYQENVYDVIFKNHRFYFKDEAFYQIKNFSLALEMAEYLEGSVKDVQAIINQSKWKGRFEWVNDHILIDGAHNREGIENLLKSLEIYGDIEWTILYAGLRDKDYLHILESLAQKSASFYVTSFDFPRALQEEDYQSLPYVYVSDWQDFLETSSHEKILVTGSLYFISEVRAYFEDKKRR